MQGHKDIVSQQRAHHHSQELNSQVSLPSVFKYVFHLKHLHSKQVPVFTEARNFLLN